MKKFHKEVFLMLVCCIAVPYVLDAQKAHKHRRNADLFYDQGEYTVAEEEYRKANSAEPAPEITYNLGNTVYQQERLEEAVRQFESAAEMAEDNDLKSDTVHPNARGYQRLAEAVHAVLQSHGAL